MIRTSLIALAALVAAAPAEATIRFNGFGENGANLNGIKYNGVKQNGTAAQRFAPVLEGIILPSGVILLAR
jgi:hypothetical protein